MSDNANSFVEAAAMRRRRPVSTAPSMLNTEEAEAIMFKAESREPDALASATPSSEFEAEDYQLATRTLEVLTPSSARSARISVPKPSNHGLDLLRARRKERIQLTTLSVRIPIEYDNALRELMDKEGLEKTAIVILALEQLLGDRIKKA